jgi:uncharacterized protein (DUF885 family)
MQRFVVGLSIAVSVSGALVLGAACAKQAAPIAPAVAGDVTPAAPAAPVTPAAPPAPSPAQSKQQLDALLAEQWEYTLERSPEMASILGDRRYNDRWSDVSLAGIANDLAKTRAFLTRFEALSTAGLSEQDVLSVQLMVRALKEQLDNARFENWLMPVNQFWGVHIGLASLVPSLPFATAKDYDDYVVRLTKIPTVFEQTVALMKDGLTKQLVPPTILLAQCVTQAQALATGKVDASPFASPLKKFPAAVTKAEQARIRAATLAAIKDKVLPAYAAFTTFLRDEYVPHGRKELGIWSLPDGDARYAALIKSTTTTAMTAEAIHELGLSEVARIEAEQAAIGKKLGFADFAKFKAHVRSNRKLYAKSRKDILQRYRKFTAQMYAKIPELFGRLPKQKMEIEAVEAFREKEASGAQYDQGTQDGSRPGMVRVNTYDPTHRLTIDIESTAYHEGVPGHHLQIAIQQELGELPPFRQQGGYGAYQEGWALYSERLGKEVGFYQDPYSDYGRLQDEMLRAIRLVVDTGLHAKHWSREQVVTFFHDHSTIDEPSVQSETNRYIAVPSQALGYKIGQLTISRLRDKAQKTLGQAFDIRGFHDEILGAGALPLDVLERRIDAWIARQQKA